MDTIISHSATETMEQGRAFAAMLRSGDVVALEGDLGAGKTHFIKGIAAGLGHEGEVTSPTFTLVHEYTGGTLPLYHFDFYRIESAAELAGLGLEDYLAEKGVVAVEWAGKFPGALPPGTWWLRFQTGPEDSRVIEVSRQ